MCPAGLVVDERMGNKFGFMLIVYLALNSVLSWIYHTRLSFSFNPFCNIFYISLSMSILTQTREMDALGQEIEGHIPRKREEKKEITLKCKTIILVRKDLNI